MIIAAVDDTSDGPVVIFGGRSEIGVELARQLAPGATVVLAARTPDRLSEQVTTLEKAGAAKVDVREFDADDLASHGCRTVSERGIPAWSEYPVVVPLGL